MSQRKCPRRLRSWIKCISLPPTTSMNIFSRISGGRRSSRDFRVDLTQAGLRNGKNHRRFLGSGSEKERRFNFRSECLEKALCFKCEASERVRRCFGGGGLETERRRLGRL